MVSSALEEPGSIFPRVKAIHDLISYFLALDDVGIFLCDYDLGLIFQIVIFLFLEKRARGAH